MVELKQLNQIKFLMENIEINLEKINSIVEQEEIIELIQEKESKKYYFNSTLQDGIQDEF